MIIKWYRLESGSYMDKTETFEIDRLRGEWELWKCFPYQIPETGGFWRPFRIGRFKTLRDAKMAAMANGRDG